MQNKLKLMVAILVFFNSLVVAKVKKYAVFGGPGVGKSTLIKSLGDKGYPVFNEVAESIIKEDLAEEEPHPALNMPVFQRRILERQMEVEENLEGFEEVFFDSGLFSTPAWSQFCNLPVPENFEQDLKKHERYDLVFCLEYPKDDHSNYEKNEVRTQTLDESLAVHEVLKKTYKEYGYDFIEVPFFEDNEERVKFVCDILAKKKEKESKDNS